VASPDTGRRSEDAYSGFYPELHGSAVHLDHKNRTVYYIISGTMTLLLNDKEYKAKAGPCHISRVKHGHRNDGKDSSYPDGERAFVQGSASLRSVLETVTISLAIWYAGPADLYITHSTKAARNPVLACELRPNASDVSFFLTRSMGGV